ncbi:MAG TPA: FAD-dependent oxidoreductase [Desulfobacteria bacterium]|nr:FAD-dependent oxidoreductase [Desulfobacteria bacterium]
MVVKRVVIIGGGAAGIDVLELLLRAEVNAEQLELTLLKKEREGFFSSCGLPFALQGLYDIQELVLFEPDFYRDKGVDFRTGIEVTSIDVEHSSVRVDTDEEIPYDYLVIATGSKPFIPPIDGTNLEGVFTLWGREDGERIKAVMDAPETSNAVIMGGGMIGLQAAVAFAKKGIKTMVVELVPRLLPTILDPDVASVVQKWLRNDVTFILGKPVSALKGEQHVKSVSVGGEDIPADIVLIAAGMRPNVAIAREAGIEIGESGGIVVDHSLRVKKGHSYLPNVYALGDCIEVTDAVTNRPRLSQLASTALIQARVVTNNLRGVSSSYESCLSPTIATISGLQVGSVGVTSACARSNGMTVKAGRAIKYTKARFFPTRKLIIAKVLFEADTAKLIGAQLVSEETVAERINELTLAIKTGITASDIVMRERCFEPSLTMVEDVIVDAALKARQQQ